MKNYLSADISAILLREEKGVKANGFCFFVVLVEEEGRVGEGGLYIWEWHVRMWDQLKRVTWRAPRKGDVD